MNWYYMRTDGQIIRAPEYLIREHGGSEMFASRPDVKGMVRTNSFKRATRMLQGSGRLAA